MLGYTLFITHTALAVMSFGIGFYIATVTRTPSSDIPDTATRDQQKYDEGFLAAMTIVRQRNSARGKKAAARRQLRRREDTP